MKDVTWRKSLSRPEEIAAEVRRTVGRVNPCIAAGPDNIPGQVLRHCAAQLTEGLIDISNISLQQPTVLAGFKAATIISVPKKATVPGLNNYCLEALTVMKCFEQLVMDCIKSHLPATLDPFLFANHSNSSTPFLSHLENNVLYTRMLVIDFTSALNMFISSRLVGKLSLLELNTPFFNWILDFLMGRPLSIQLGSNISGSITPSTGAPQGCVLSPPLFTVLTHNFTVRFCSKHIIKFICDTTVVDLISNSDEVAYREEVERLIKWGKNNNFSCNMAKTKKMIVDFRKARVSQSESDEHEVPWCVQTWTHNISALARRHTSIYIF
ncbi:uncharacterized protein LOC132378514 [Hypanus sabinus]|uniref:uncharacterized protein LOC132378514 n=1 Tax=Hypanus sabinus TaxID=79690 RepID=UPI0028C3D45E|nr:uncharacterized protein LOC132378514 [Hypanus sabinus]XP_059801455.1 uncharacterized protein LOC132378514 [Hypanus sabinus]